MSTSARRRLMRDFKVLVAVDLNADCRECNLIRLLESVPRQSLKMS